MIKKLWQDFRGLRRVCGPGVALRWLWSIARTAPRCFKSRNLSPADVAMGEGPFTCRLRGSRAKLGGWRVMGSIRELWVRDVYLHGGTLTVPPDGVVVDLGANRGFFTALALGHGPEVRAVCVEPRKEDCEHIRQNMALNGWQSRVQIFNCFVGATTAAQADMVGTDPEVAGVPFWDEDRLIAEGGLTRVDLLKVDVEGSEFGLLRPDSRLLAMSRQVAVEIHAWGGRPEDLLATLRGAGFEMEIVHEDPHGMIALGARRHEARPAAA